MSQKTKQIVIAIVVIIIAFIGFKVFFGGSDSGSATLVADQSSQQYVDSQAIIVLLNRLNQVTLDQAIFSNPIFTGLMNFEKPIPPQIPGRNNPFAPIGSDGSPTTIRTAATTTRTR